MQSLVFLLSFLSRRFGRNRDVEWNLGIIILPSASRYVISRVNCIDCISST
jgi:hypothetical protein